MSTPEKKLMYTPCRVCLKAGLSYPNEGLYTCNLCHTSYCEEHMCDHLRVDFEREEEHEININARVMGRANAAIPLIAEHDGQKSYQSVEKIVNKELQLISEPTLRARLRYVLAEAKAIQNELLRRMIESAGIAQTQAELARLKNDEERAKHRKQAEMLRSPKIQKLFEDMAKHIKRGSTTVDKSKAEIFGDSK